MRWTGAFAVSILALLAHVTASAYVQSGTCYTNYAISVTSCADVTSACSSNSCSSTNGDVSFTCFAPRSCSGTARQGVVSPSPTTGAGGSSASSTYNGYDQSGTCYSIHGIKITSCNDLNGICSSRRCSTVNNVIQYSCGSYCTGTASPATPAPTPSTALSGNCILGRGLTLTTCADTTSFNNINCTCYKCSEENGHISLSCSSPFVCSNEIEPPGSAEAEPPKLDTGSYAIICGVYGGLALLVAAIAWWTKPKQAPQDAATPETSKMNPLYYIQGALGIIRSFVIDPNVRDDGSLTTMCEFWASSCPWVALVHCGRHRNPPPHYKAPMTRTRAFLELFGDSCITASLSFLLGTVVNNSEACSSIINGDHCQTPGMTIDSRVSSSQTSGACQSIDIENSFSAYIVSIVLTKTVAAAGSYAEKTAKNDNKRMSRVDKARILITLLLLVFGFVYSYFLVSKFSGAEVAKRRYQMIRAILLPTYAFDQATSVLKMIGQRCCKVCVTVIPKDLRAAKSDQLPGSVVRPTTTEIKLQQPEAPIETPQQTTSTTSATSKVASRYEPSTPGPDEIDEIIGETEATTYEKYHRR